MQTCAEIAMQIAACQQEVQVLQATRSTLEQIQQGQLAALQAAYAQQLQDLDNEIAAKVATQGQLETDYQNQGCQA